MKTLQTFWAMPISEAACEAIIASGYELSSQMNNRLEFEKGNLEIELYYNSMQVKKDGNMVLYMNIEGKEMEDVLMVLHMLSFIDLSVLKTKSYDMQTNSIGDCPDVCHVHSSIHHGRVPEMVRA
jgi:hypothetical protein